MVDTTLDVLLEAVRFLMNARFLERSLTKHEHDEFMGIFSKLDALIEKRKGKD